MRLEHYLHTVGVTGPSPVAPTIPDPLYDVLETLKNERMLWTEKRVFGIIGANGKM